MILFWGKVSNCNVSPEQLSVHLTNEKLTRNVAEVCFDQIDWALEKTDCTFLAIHCEEMHIVATFQRSK